MSVIPCHRGVHLCNWPACAALSVRALESSEAALVSAIAALELAEALAYESAFQCGLVLRMIREEEKKNG